MENTNQNYNIKGGFVNVSDALRAFDDGNATISFKTRPFEGKTYSYVDVKLLICGTNIRTIVFKNTRFEPVYLYKGESTWEKKLSNTGKTNTYVLIRSSRKIQNVSRSGYPWKI